ncbi:MAG: amidohydrolase family protein [Myxococcales bacterium]
MSARAPAPIFVAGARLAGAPGGPRTLRIVEGRIDDLDAHAPAGADVVDARGLFLAPFAVDAHVHLAFACATLPEGARALLAGGVSGALDLGMPERFLPALGEALPLVLRSSGPLLTAPGGYPTQSWGRDGYGLALDAPEQAAAAVSRLAAAGAFAIKLSLDGRFPVLAPAVAEAASRAAHAAGLRVFAHALTADAVRAALAAGADVLAHTPTEPLSEALVAEVGARRLHVISTLQACGGSATQLGNLSRLRAAGARVVYGTDLGNEGTAPGISAAELLLLAQAGMSAREILHAATLEAALLLGEPALGRLAVGAPAHLLALAEDPLRDASALARPAFALIGGVRRDGAGAA